MDRVLVTGGARFMGSNFIRHLLNNTKSNVINLHKLTYDYDCVRTGAGPQVRDRTSFVR